MRSRKLKNAATVSLLIALCVLLIVFSNSAQAAAATAVRALLNKILPTLIPFFIISNVITAVIADSEISPKAITFLIGSVCGNPVGATMVQALFEKGKISKSEASALLAASAHTSPAFCICIIGNALNSKLAGFFIWAISLAFGIIPLVLHKKEKTFAKTEAVTELEGWQNIVMQATKKAAETSCAVFVLTVFFASFSAVLKELLSLNEASFALLAFFLEIGSGITSAEGLAFEKLLPISSFGAVFCGTSVYMQICSCAPDVPKTKYVLTKSIGAITLLIATSLFVRF